jgi:hypothetical protein
MSAVENWQIASAHAAVTPLTEIKAVTGEKTSTTHWLYRYVFLYKNMPGFRMGGESGAGDGPTEKSMAICLIFCSS